MSWKVLRGNESNFSANVSGPAASGKGFSTSPAIITYADFKPRIFPRTDVVHNVNVPVGPRSNNSGTDTPTDNGTRTAPSLPSTTTDPNTFTTTNTPLPDCPTCGNCWLWLAGGVVAGIMISKMKRKK